MLTSLRLICQKDFVPFHEDDEDKYSCILTNGYYGITEMNKSLGTWVIRKKNWKYLAEFFYYIG